MLDVHPLSGVEFGEQADNRMSPRILHRTSSRLPETSTKQPIGLGLEGVHSDSRLKGIAFPEHLPSDVVDTPIKRRPQRVSMSANPQSLSPPRQGLRPRRIVSEPPAPPRSEPMTTLRSNHVEVDLHDVESDSPTFRASLQGLDKRTALLKQSAKALLKAATDVVASIDDMQASDNSFEQAFKDLGSFFPATFQAVVSDHLLKKRQEEHLKREQESRLFVVHIIAPMRLIADQCRDAQHQIRLFDAESKSYYTATQKWLSFRGSNKSVSTGDKDIYSPEAVGFDKSMVKQERIDDKQRLRQAKFDLARYRIFRTIFVLHGGEMEMMVAGHLLAKCRWQLASKACNEAQFGSLDEIERGARREGKRCQDAMEVIDAKCNDLQRYIHELSSSLVKNSQGFEADTTQINEASAIPLASRRFRGLMSSIGMHGGSGSTDNGLTPAQQGCSTSQMSSPRKASSPTSGPAAIESMWSKVLKPVSNLQARRDGNGRAVGSYDYRQDNELVCKSPTTRQPSVPESVHVNHTQGVIPEGKSNYTNSQHCAQQSLSTSSESSRTMDLVKPAHSLANPSKSVDPTSILQRKKEGILWALSKPIQAICDDDAPRAFSRSQNWRECWVVLSGSGHLGEYAHWKDASSATLNPSQPIIDLRFATVREGRGTDRRFVFEVITRDTRRLFQASNEEEMRSWISAISFAIECLLNGTSSVRQVEKVAKNSLHDIPVGIGLEQFGARHVFETSYSSPVTFHKNFSQSLTDLGSSAGGRLFPRNRRDSREVKRNHVKGHPTTHSEGKQNEVGFEYHYDIPELSTPISREKVHGISNKTPVSGYIASRDSLTDETVPSHSGRKVKHLSVSSVEYSQTSSAYGSDSDFDRQIERVIESNYGSPNPKRHSSQFHQQRVLVPHEGASFGQSEEPVEQNKCLSRQTRAQEILSIAQRAGNRSCADCKRPDPRWASWALNGRPCCIFLCIACSGIHRSLGVQISKVKSIDLDDWTEEQILSAERWGNSRANAMYEAKKPKAISATAPDPSDPKAFWIQKYERKAWYVPEDDNEETTIPTVRASVLSKNAIMGAKSSSPYSHTSTYLSPFEATGPSAMQKFASGAKIYT